MKKHKIMAKYHHSRYPKFHQSESGLSPFLCHFLGWSSVLIMGVLALLLFKKNDIKIPQKEVIINLQVKSNEINICLPDEEN